MATRIKHVWTIPKETFIWYLETLGVSTQEIKDIQENFESTIEIEYFDELQLIGNWINTIPDSSIQLIPYLNGILEHICSMERDNFLGKFFTIKPVQEIINITIDYIATSEDETINFDKTNKILLMILQELNKLLDNFTLLLQFADFCKLPTPTKFIDLVQQNQTLTYILTIISNLHTKKLSIFIGSPNKINEKKLANAAIEIIASMKIQEKYDKKSKTHSRKPKKTEELIKRTPYINSNQ